MENHSGFKLHCFSSEIGETRYLYEVLSLKDTVFIVITLKGNSSFNDLSVAMKNRFENTPVGTKIMGDFLDDASKEIAVRLVKKLNKPVYVSFNVNVDKRTVSLIERQLCLEIRNKPEAF